METEIAEDESCCLDVSLQAEHVCAHCEYTLCSPVGLVLLDEATIACFYDEHDIDLSDRHYWTLPWCVDDEYTTIEQRDPMRISIRIPIGEDDYHVVIDDDLTIVDTTCVSCSG